MDGRREGVSHARDGDVRPGTDGNDTHTFLPVIIVPLFLALEVDAKVLNSV